MSFEMFFTTNKPQRKRSDRVTVYIMRFKEGIKTLQHIEINLRTIDDVPGWVLMRKASLTQEGTERLIAALPDEHFGINDVKRVLVRLSLNCTSMSTVSLMKTQDGRETTTLDPRRRIRVENTRRTHADTTVLSRLAMSGRRN